MTYQEIVKALRKEASMKKLSDMLHYQLRDKTTNKMPQGHFYGEQGYKPLQGNKISQWDYPMAPSQNLIEGTKQYNAAVKGLTPEQLKGFNSWRQDYLNRHNQALQKFRKDNPNLKSPWIVR